MVTGGGPGGSTWLRSLSPELKASGALTRAGAAEWQGLACVTACVRLLGREYVWPGVRNMMIPEMVSQVGWRHGDCDESLHVSPRT